MMNQTITLALSILSGAVAQSSPREVPVRMVHKKTTVGTPTVRHSTCSYRGLYKRDFTASIVVTGIFCPLAINYYPDSGTWTK